MMKSLWSGVSGLQAHQIAMDVEAHNIANVNTVGFKYSRANFGDMLSQTIKIATAPQGEMGGKNDLQVGLGSNITSTTRIFTQGSTQATGKNTDLAMQGDGFFIVTHDGGQTYKYSRNGDFNLDANGNLTDANGLIVQGWKKEIRGGDDSCGGDGDANKVDSTQPIQNIVIKPGLKIPAKKTSHVELKANLNGGQVVESKVCIFKTNAEDGLTFSKAALSLNSIPSPDMAGLFDEYGHRFNLQDGEGTRVRIIDPSNSKNFIDIDVLYSNSYDPSSMDVKSENWASSLAKAPAPKLKEGEKAPTKPTQPQAVTPKVRTVRFSNVEQLMANMSQAMNNIALQDPNVRSFANSRFEIGTDEKSFALINGSGKNSMKIAIGAPTTGESNNNTYMSRMFEGLMGHTVSSDKTLGIRVGAIGAGGEGHTKDIKTMTYESKEDVGVLFNSKGESINLQSATTRAEGLQDGQGFKLTLGGVNSDGFSKVTRTLTFRYTDEKGKNPATTKTITSAHDDDENAVYFKSTEDLRTLLQQFVRDIDSDGNIDNNVDVIADKYGRFQFQNFEKSDTKNISMKVHQLNDENTVVNERFHQILNSLDGVLETGKIRTTQSFNAATHATSIEIFDSLGTKHTLRLEFKKTSTGTWDWRAVVADPGSLSGAHPEGNILRNGTVQFGSDGALTNFNPPTLTYSPNNGAKGDQIVQLNFGALGGYEGVTSLDAKSTTSGISQNGYASGDLLGIRVDQVGGIIGSFSNGRSMALAQVAVAKFTNNAGLSSQGSNLYKQTANSGEAIIGTPGSGGRGSIVSSSLEMSNVDLSRSLTNLIVIQRGFQANSKAITTSDQLLDTLINLKR